MKFEITKKGVHDSKGKKIPVGTVIDVKGDVVPAWLLNKGNLTGTKAGKAAVTNPASEPIQQSAAERRDLLKGAAIQIGAADFLDDGRPDVRAVNGKLTDAAVPFNAAERDELWPGIAEAVKAGREAA